MSHPPIPQLLNTAVQYHQAGYLAEAEQRYRQILAHQPDQVDALYLLGVVAYQTGQAEAAIAQYRQAIALNPDHAEARCNLGVALRQQGEVEAAIAEYQRAIALKPNYVEAYFNLGNALRDRQQWNEAVEQYQQAIALRPNYVEAYCNLASTLANLGQPDAAMAQYRLAIALRPNFASAHYNLANILRETGQTTLALYHYQQAIQHNPDHIDAHLNLAGLLIVNNQTAAAEALWERIIVHCNHVLSLNPASAIAHYGLASTYRKQELVDLALQHYQDALRLDPVLVQAHSDLGTLLQQQGDLEVSVFHLQRAIDLDPTNPQCHYNLGLAYQFRREPERAIAAQDRAIALNPDYVDAHCSRAADLLMAGRLIEGFTEYEWRWRRPDFAPMAVPQPWDGTPLPDQTMLLYTEQGFGDAIQFIRYAPLVAERVGRVIVLCRPSLLRLFVTTPGVNQVIDGSDPLPPFDLRVPLMSLPRIFGTTLDTIPAAIPYLSAPIRYDLRLTAPSPDQRKVGLVWTAGNFGLQKELARSRSCGLAYFHPLLSVPNIAFYSLQKGEAEAELGQFEWASSIVDLSPQIHDFADTAAAIAQLDLVITVDTAVAHLAGAMGKPVWVLLPYSADWRWLINREDTPWYPTMRLFRQTQPAAWSALLQQVADCLQRSESS